MNTTIQPIDIFRYYVSYKDIEEPILLAIHGRELEPKREALKKYMNSYMRIGRNFKALTDDMVLGTTSNLFYEGSSDVDEISARFSRGELLSGKSKNAFVAASKMMWLFNKSVIIMDGNNRKALGVKERANYKDYCEAWKTAFAVAEPLITAIMKKHKLAEIDHVMNENWFKMRVFDQYLWSMNN